MTTAAKDETAITELIKIVEDYSGKRLGSGKIGRAVAEQYAALVAGGVALRKRRKSFERIVPGIVRWSQGDGRLKHIFLVLAEQAARKM